MNTLAPTPPFPSDPAQFEISNPTPQQVGDFMAQTYRNILETMKESPTTNEP